MRSDIRIISLPDPFGGEMYQVGVVEYDDIGEIHGIKQVLNESATMEGALAFLDQMYKATLKPVLVKLENGEWE